MEKENLRWCSLDDVMEGEPVWLGGDRFGRVVWGNSDESKLYVESTDGVPVGLDVPKGHGVYVLA